VPVTLADLQQSSWTPTADFVVTPSATWQAGDYILVVGGTEGNSVTFATPTATGLTFALIGTASGSSQTSEYMWSALAASGGSGAVTALRDDATSFVAASCGLSVFVYRNCIGFGTPAVLTSSPLTVVDLARTQAHSDVVAVFGDGPGDLTVTPQPADGVQQLAVTNVGDADFWIFTWADQTAAGTTSYGMTNHVVQVQMSALAVEVKAILVPAAPWNLRRQQNRPAPFKPGRAR
jgi:hypothetical protein